MNFHDTLRQRYPGGAPDPMEGVEPENEPEARRIVDDWADAKRGELCYINRAAVAAMPKWKQKVFVAILAQIAMSRVKADRLRLRAYRTLCLFEQTLPAVGRRWPARR